MRERLDCWWFLANGMKIWGGRVELFMPFSVFFLLSLLYFHIYFFLCCRCSLSLLHVYIKVPKMELSRPSSRVEAGKKTLNKKFPLEQIRKEISSFSFSSFSLSRRTAFFRLLLTRTSSRGESVNRKQHRGWKGENEFSTVVVLSIISNFAVQKVFKLLLWDWDWSEFEIYRFIRISTLSVASLTAIFHGELAKVSHREEKFFIAPEKRHRHEMILPLARAAAASHFHVKYTWQAEVSFSRNWISFTAEEA